MSAINISSDSPSHYTSSEDELAPTSPTPQIEPPSTQPPQIEPPSTQPQPDADSSSNGLSNGLSNMDSFDEGESTNDDNIPNPTTKAITPPNKLAHSTTHAQQILNEWGKSHGVAFTRGQAANYKNGKPSSHFVPLLSQQTNNL